MNFEKVKDPTTQRNFEQIGNTIFKGKGTPEGVVRAGVGAMYLREDGGIGSTLYVKEVGINTTGWAAK